jgi:hypothetical protein
MIGPCAICRREIRAGFGFAPSLTKPTTWTCSAECVALAAKLYGKPMTENETEARRLARTAAGQFLDTLDVTNPETGEILKGGDAPLALLTAEQFSAFFDRFAETYHVALVELAGGNKAPF